MWGPGTFGKAACPSRIYFWSFVYDLQVTFVQHCLIPVAMEESALLW